MSNRTHYFIYPADRSQAARDYVDDIANLLRFAEAKAI